MKTFLKVILVVKMHLMEQYQAPWASDTFCGKNVDDKNNTLEVFTDQKDKKACRKLCDKNP